MRFLKKRQLTDYEKEMYELDWFRRTSWFSSYFWEKVKNMLLNFIYSLYTSIEDKLLKNYFLEIKFSTSGSRGLKNYNLKHGTNYTGDYVCMLPIILRTSTIEEAFMIQTKIVAELAEKGCSIISSNVSKEFGTPQMLETKLETCRNILKSSKTGSLEIQTWTPTPLSSDDESEEGIVYNKKGQKFKARLSDFKFKMMKTWSSNFTPLDLDVIIEKPNSQE